MYQELTRLRVAAAVGILASEMGLGDNIRTLREAHGHKNAAAFARAIGVSAGTLGNWEKGLYTNLRLASLMKIAKKIPCRVDDLLVGVDAVYDEIAKNPPRKALTQPVTPAASNSATLSGHSAEQVVAEFELSGDPHVVGRDAVPSLASHLESLISKLSPLVGTSARAATQLAAVCRALDRSGLAIRLGQAPERRPTARAKSPGTHGVSGEPRRRTGGRSGGR